jgi:hypothetical protein
MSAKVPQNTPIKEIAIFCTNNPEVAEVIWLLIKLG